MYLLEIHLLPPDWIWLLMILTLSCWIFHVYGATFRLIYRKGKSIPHTALLGPVHPWEAAGVKRSRGWQVAEQHSRSDTPILAGCSPLLSTMGIQKHPEISFTWAKRQLWKLYQSLNKITTPDCSRHTSLSDALTISPFLLLPLPPIPGGFLCCGHLGVRDLTLLQDSDTDHTGISQCCTRKVSDRPLSKKPSTRPKVTSG